MSVTASSMIFNGLSMLGEKGPGGTLTSAEQTYWLDRLNAMLDSWSLERLMCYQVVQESFSLSVSTISYTIGNVSSATLSTARPVEIVKAFVRDSQSFDTELEIIGYDTYDSIRVKSTGVSYPNYLYYDQAYPLGTIRVYPAPQTGLTLFIDSNKQIQSFASITTVINLPTGYQRAIESNFAVEASPGFASASPELIMIAKQSKAYIKNINLRTPVLQMDSSLVGGRSGNIYTGP